VLYESWGINTPLGGSRKIPARNFDMKSGGPPVKVGVGCRDLRTRRRTRRERDAAGIKQGGDEKECCNVLIKRCLDLCICGTILNDRHIT